MITVIVYYVYISAEMDTPKTAVTSFFRVMEFIGNINSIVDFLLASHSFQLSCVHFFFV